MQPCIRTVLCYFWYEHISLFLKELFIKFYSTSYCVSEHGVNSHPAAHTEERKKGSRLLNSTVPQNTLRTACLLSAMSRIGNLFFFSFFPPLSL